MFPPLVHLHCGDLLQDGVVEGHVEVEGYAVQTLETEYQLVKEKLSLLKCINMRLRTGSSLRDNRIMQS